MAADDCVLAVLDLVSDSAPLALLAWLVLPAAEFDLRFAGRPPFTHVEREPVREWGSHLRCGVVPSAGLSVYCRMRSQLQHDTVGVLRGHHLRYHFKT